MCGLALNEAGTNPSGLGIGFVQSIGDGMTAAGSMPNFGSADLQRQLGWHRAGGGSRRQRSDVTLTTELPLLTADFNDNEVTVDLTGLAMLEGDISGGMFSGDQGDGG